MKKILLGLGVLALVAVAGFAGTQAFFSDTETSQGNTFAAGAIDLTVGNSSYVTDENGDVVHSENTSWSPGDLEGEVFFDFADLKPGDIGEDTITINVDDNDSWACMANNITATPENDVTDPESDDDDTPGADEGELQDELQFAVWADDGDNVYENDERLLQLGGDGEPFVTAQDLHEQGVQTLADSNYSLFTDGNEGEPLEGEQDYHLAKAWCLGELSENPVAQDDGHSPVDGTGFECDGAGLDNSTQTDGIEADIQFYAVQSRNNDGFSCEEDFTPNWDDQDNGSDITINTDKGWSPEATGNEELGVNRWVGKARYGNQQDLNQTYELEVGFGSSGDRDEGDHDYTDDSSETFTLDYDSSNDEATLTVGNDSVTYTVDGPATAIGITAKGSDTNGDTRFENADINGTSIPDMVATSNHVHTSLSGAGISGDFTLTGDLTLDWDSPVNENPTLQVDVLY